MHNNDLISRSAVIDHLKAKVCNDCYVLKSGGKCGGCFIRAALDMIEDVAAVDAVSPGVLEQYKWERDTAIGQLKELGIGFGQKKPDIVEVVRCKDCMHFNHAVIGDDPANTFEVDVCLHKDLFPTRVTPDFYCAHGAKMDAEVEG